MIFLVFINTKLNLARLQEDDGEDDTDEDADYEVLMTWPTGPSGGTLAHWPTLDKAPRLIIRLLFGFVSDSETSAATPCEVMQKK